MTLSTPELRSAWGPGCATPAELTIVHTWTGVAVTQRRGTEDAWRALDDVMRFHAYAPRAGVTGGFNCRPITGGTGLSLHAFGIARDTNWDTNPYGPTLVTDRPPQMIIDLAAIRTVDGAQVFRWGGTYSGNKDAMHDEIAITPAALARGINWDTVAGHVPPTPVPLPPGDPMATLTEADLSYLQALRVRDVLDLYAEVYGPSFAPDHAGLEYWIAQSVGKNPDGSDIGYWQLRAAFMGAVSASLVAAGVELTGVVAPGKP